MDNNVKINHTIQDEHGEFENKSNIGSLNSPETVSMLEKRQNYEGESKKTHPRKARSEVASKSSTSSNQFQQHCINFGSQPCTCFYPDHPDVIRFEIGNDELTKNASRIGNGTGPANCTDLQAIGHTLRGFYLVRLNNTKRVSPIYCEFTQTRNNSSQGVVSQTLPLNKNAVETPPPKRLKFCGGFVGQQCTFFYSDYPDAPQYELKSNENNQK